MNRCIYITPGKLYVVEPCPFIENREYIVLVLKLVSNMWGDKYLCLRLNDLKTCSLFRDEFVSEIV